MDYTNLSYVAAAILFILGIKRLSSPKTARSGNLIASVGMLIAIVATVSSFGGLDYKLIAIGMIIGSLIGATFALRVEMTQMPQMVAIFNGFGGGASALVASAEFFSKYGTLEQSVFLYSTIILSVFIGTLTFTGSFIAFGKLQGFVSGQPIVFKGQQIINGIIVILLIGLGVYVTLGGPQGLNAFYMVIALSALIGITLTIPIGGA
ncbi:MAG: NAD(P)(+) transhydrogenase (Re/Si-specific) subunit beta, partial [Candidatus Neomarinimicrobiota bacterium]|nr:NAD(P)(+) transhydrogenase (Re/Si-specific) subunit beta [Candidatus Neomarinimicrobiota bacterium]